jgi:hypothetical protein
MGTYCRKCGAEKTDPVHGGLLFKLAKAFGYRLRVCARCRRYRLLPPVVKLDPEPVVDCEQSESGLKKDPLACPRCGKKDYQRSRRRFWERLIGRREMVRCRACGKRLPAPLRPSF